MKRFLLILTVLISGTAYADTCAKNLMPAFTAYQANVICQKYGLSQVSSIIPQAGATVYVGSVGSPIAGIYVNGVVNQAVYVPTPAATPAVASNFVKAGVMNAIPTFAANGAVLIPQAANVGDIFQVCNLSANAARVKAEGTPGINGGSSGTYVALATQQCSDFVKVSATNIQSKGLYTVPTPAGP